VGLICESEHPSIIETKAEISDLEGFFCTVRFIGQREKGNIPRTSAVYVSVYGNAFTEIGTISPTNHLYKERVLQFDITLISDIRVESRFRKGV